MSACQANKPQINTVIVEKELPSVIVYSDLETVGDYIFAVEAAKAGAIIK